MAGAGPVHHRVITVAACSAVLLAAGCGAGQSATSAAPASPSALRPLAAGYLAIASAGNKRLETDFDRLDGPDRGNLAAARADLTDVAATERRFDRRLLAIKFPPAIEATARDLVTANEARARLTTAAAASASLSQLAACRPRLTAANAPVEAAVRTIRHQLGLPPPETS